MASPNGLIMKKTAFLLLTITCLTATVLSQSKLSPVTLSTDSIESFLLDSTQIQIYIDKKGTNDIKEISALSNQFVFNTSSIADAEKVGAIWVQYQLINNSSSSIDISVGTEADTVLTYLFQGNATKPTLQFLSGKKVSWSKKDGFKESELIPVQIGANQTFHVYQRLKNPVLSPEKQIAVGIFSTQKIIHTEFIEKERQVIDLSHYGNIFFAGFFLLAALFNLLLYKVTKEREYFLLAGFLFFLFIQMNPWFTTVFARENFWLSHKIEEAGLMYLVFLFQFVRHFFNTRLRIRKWDKVLYVVNFALSLSIISEVLLNGNSTVELIRSVIFVGATCLYLATLVYLFRVPGKERKLFAGAMMPFLVCFLSLFVVAIVYIVFSVTGNTSLDQFFEWVGEWAYLINNIAISWAVLYFAHILFRRFEAQKKAIAVKELEKEQERNALIAVQKIELENQVNLRTSELEESLLKLTKTQNQLIHAEKMAALGQLTSGIAHEIQNPLNFVSNFSEVNEELIEEMKLSWMNDDKSLVEELIRDINENTRKINFHSKRADAIVKGMLQHSQVNHYEKELTDINWLCEEMLRISYQTTRSKNNVLKVKFIADYDHSAGEVFVYKKEISRVLLNILNNAFYALSEKLVAPGQKENQDADDMIDKEWQSNLSTGHFETGSLIASTTKSYGFKRQSKEALLPESYEPVIWITTLRNENSLEIRIKDNGTGISASDIGKIFQPFFTTKPTGSGTGLGLSLAYEIITRGHSGELLVSSKKGEYSEFIIRLPF